MSIAPFAAPLIFSFAAGTMSAAIATAVTAGLLDAALQGVAIGVGLQDNFSFTNVIEAASLTGFMAAAKGAAIANEAAHVTAVRSMMAMGKATVSSQLVELSMGLRKDFDVKAVLSSMANGYANARINIPNTDKLAGRVAANAVTNLSGTAITSLVYRNDPNLQSMAAQMLGSTIATEAGRELQGHLERNPEPEHRVPKSQNTRAHVEELPHSHLADLKIDLTDEKWRNDLYELGHQPQHSMDKLDNLLAQQKISRLARWAGASREANRFNVHTAPKQTISFFNEFANSKVINGINTVGDVVSTNTIGAINWVGDWVSSTPQFQAFTSINPMVQAPLFINTALDSLLQGDIPGSIGAAGFAAMSTFPGEKALFNVAQQGSVYLSRGIQSIPTIASGLWKTGVNIIEAGVWKASGSGASVLKSALGEVRIFGSESSTVLTEGLHHLDPKIIRFTQPNVSPNFNSGSSVNEFIKDLRAGKVSPYEVTPIQVVQKDGKLFSIDNRRLLAFNAAGVEKIPVEIVSLKNPSIADKFFDRFKPIRGEGNYVVVVNRSQREEALDLLEKHNLITRNNHGY